MSAYYPQACVQLRVTWENHQSTDKTLNAIYTMTTLAKRVTVNINDYRQADTFSMELDYKTFPFDPRLIRGLGVTIYVEDMKGLYGTDGMSLQIKPENKNAVFQGFADEETIEFNDNSRTLRFEGRDFTALFIDSPYGFGTVDMGKPLDKVLEGIIAQTKGAEKIEVENRTGVTLPTLAKYYPDFSSSKTAGRKNVSRNSNTWDVIQDLAFRAGLVAYIEIDQLVLTKPRNIYAGAKAYQFVHGRNVKSLKFSRKLSRQKGFNIVVRSLFLEGKEVMNAEIPKDATLSWCKAMGLKKAPTTVRKPSASAKGKDNGGFEDIEAPYLSFIVPNVRNKEQLIEVGQGIFEELGRQQIEGSLETKEMAILQMDPPYQDYVEFDCRKIRNGTPISISLVQDDMEQVKAMTEAQREEYLVGRGYERDVAHVLAVSQGKHPTTFYTKAVEFTLDQEQGFSMRLEFLNYIDLKERGI